MSRLDPEVEWAQRWEEERSRQELARAAAQARASMAAVDRPREGRGSSRPSRRGDGPAPGRLTGLAVVYNSPSLINEDGLTIWEVVRPRSLQLPASGRDVISTYNHSRNQLLARQANDSLTLEETDEGVRFAARLPRTQLGRDVASMAEEQLLRGCSFAFSIPAGGQEFRRAPDGRLLRTISRYTLFELGPVTEPAYLSTTLGVTDDRQTEGELAGRVAFTLAWGEARAVAPPAAAGRLEVRTVPLTQVEVR